MMDYVMDERQVKICGESLMITSGRLDRESSGMMETATDEKRLPSDNQKKMDFLYSTPRRKNSKAEPYIPPHRRIPGFPDQNGISESKPKPLRPPNSTYSSHKESKNDFSDPSFKARDPCNKNITDASKRRNFYSIVHFLDFQKNFTLVNATGSNQVEDNNGDYDLIAERVLKLVDTHVNNGLKEILDGLYEQNYGEVLPPDLLSRWKFIVTLTNVPQVSNRQYSSSARQVETPKTQIVPTSLNLQKLEKEFWVMIHRCRSVTELWGIIMDSNHLGKVEKLSEQMQLAYENLKTPNNDIVNNSFYAMFDGSWHRVLCLQCDGSQATVLFIDRGDEDIVPINKLHILNPQFCTLPAQAIRMSLDGLEVFANLNELQSILIDTLCDRDMFAKVKAVSEDYLSVQLYSPNENDETINVNEMIIDQMLKKLLNPQLCIQARKIEPAHVSHLENTIYVQLDIPSFKYINLLMEKAVKEYISNKDCQRQIVVRHEADTIYFVKSNEDQNWYRGKIMKFIDDNEIQVFLIDVGSFAETNRENIIYLEKVYSILAKYPAQAIEVKLDQIPSLNSKMLASLRNIVSRRKNLFVEFISVGENNNLPTVKLMRKAENGFFNSINDALLILDEETQCNKNDSLVLAQEKDLVDKSINKNSSATSLLSTKPSMIEPRLSVDKFSNNYLSTSSLQSTKSSHSAMDSRLSINKYDGKDFDTTSVKSSKNPTEAKIATTNYGIKHISPSTSHTSIPSTKPSQSFTVEPKASQDKFRNKDFDATSVKSTKQVQNSTVEPRSSIEKSTSRKSDILLIQSAKSSQQPTAVSKPSIDKSSHKNFDTLSMKSAKSQNPVGETKLPAGKLSNKSFDTLSVKSTKSSQNQKFDSSSIKSLMSAKASKAEKMASFFEQLKIEEKISKVCGLPKNTQNVEPKNTQNVEPKNIQNVEPYSKTLSSVLTAPKLPEEDFFDVQVILASDPSHFVVQLLRDKTTKFNKMVSKMSGTCRFYRGETLTSDSIQVGQIYGCKASENNDRDWCRVYVTEIKDNKTASVYFCDYGSYKTVDINNMVPLDNEFCILPYQAIWAELNGVKPNSKDWTVRACLRFQELTQSKEFVSRVVSKRDANSGSFQTSSKVPVTVETIYCLDLYDTSSPDEDINIADQLFEGGVAERC